VGASFWVVSCARRNIVEKLENARKDNVARSKLLRLGLPNPSVLVAIPVTPVRNPWLEHRSRAQRPLMSLKVVSREYRFNFARIVTADEADRQAAITPSERRHDHFGTGRSFRYLKAAQLNMPRGAHPELKSARGPQFITSPEGVRKEDDSSGRKNISKKAYVLRNLFERRTSESQDESMTGIFP